nr:hypothetical protein [Tanacetum cinerariifolium]
MRKNRNSTSPKCVHFINTITIIRKEDEPRKEGIVEPNATKYSGHNMIVEVEEKVCEELSGSKTVIERGESHDIERNNPGDRACKDEGEVEEEREWMKYDQPLNLVDPRDESVYETLIEKMPRLQSFLAIDDLSCDCGSQSHPLNLLENRRFYLPWVLGIVEGEEAYNPGVFEGKKLTTGLLINGLLCSGIDMVIKDLELEPKIDTMMREFLNSFRWKDLSKETGNEIGFLLGLSAFAMAVACASRITATPFVISCWMAASIIAGVADVNVLLGGIYQHIHSGGGIIDLIDDEDLLMRMEILEWMIQHES